MPKKRFIMITWFVLILMLTSSFTVSAKPRKTRLVAPTGLQAVNVTSTAITLKWNAVSNATQYEVYMATPNDQNFSLASSTQEATYNMSNLQPNTSYCFFVKARNTKRISPESIHVNIMTKSDTTLPTETQSKTVLGFTTYYYSGDRSSYNSMTANTSNLDSIATHTYITDDFGNISGLAPVEQLSYANKNNIKTYAMVSNNFSGDIAKTLLESENNKTNLIEKIKVALKENNYKGVNIDIEGIYATNRSHFTSFMKELYNTLNPLGYEVTISVPAKTYDSLTNSWNGAFDYAALGNYADKIVLMTYDEHYPGGSPGPVASIEWVKKVVDYAISVIPKEKILLGTAAYGYDWSSEGTKAYSINGIYKLASTYNAVIQWDSISQSPYFQYTDSNGVTHNVWFENDYSLRYKLDVVNNKDIAGIAIWRLGLENPGYWTAISEKLKN